MSDLAVSSAPRPEVSVLMASFNAERFIGEAIESVLAIEGIDIEIVVQDGSSSDATGSVVAGFQDPRISFLTEPDGGQSDAWNRALRRARGRWIGWLNADDVYFPEAAQTLTRQLSEELDFVYGDYAAIDENGRDLKRYRSDRDLTVANLLRYGTFVSCSAGFYRAETLRGLNGLDPSLHYCMDHDLLLRLASSGARCRYVPGVVQGLRTHDDAKTSRDVLGFAREGGKVTWQHAREVRGGRIRVLTQFAILFAYIPTRRIWQSALWRRIRPEARR